MKKNNYYIFLLDILLPIATYSVIHFNKFGNLIPQGIYYILLIVFLAYWYTLSTYYNKYVLKGNYLSYIKSIFSSSLITLFLITSTVSFTELISVSRLFLIQITMIPMVIEILIVIVFQKVLSSDQIAEKYKDSDTEIISRNTYKFRWIVIGGLMLFIIYFLMIKIKTGSYYLYPWSERILLTLYASWIISIIFTKRYSVVYSNVIYYQITPFIKSGMIMMLIATMLYFFFRVELLSRFLIFGTILCHSFLEITWFLLYFIIQKEKYTKIDTFNTHPLGDSLFNWDI